MLTPPLPLVASLSVLPTEAELRGKKAIQFKAISGIRQQITYVLQLQREAPPHPMRAMTMTLARLLYRAWYQQNAISSHPVPIHWPQLNIMGNSPHMRRTQGLFPQISAKRRRGGNYSCEL
jgi:hypothetical protein